MADADDRLRARGTLKTPSDGTSLPKAARATVAVLTVESGPDAERVLALETDRLDTVGRADERTIAIADARLSRMHARVVWVNGEWMVMDAGSTNGTFLNGARIEKYSRLGVTSLACCGAERDVRALLGLVDARLYEANRTGRNRVVARDETAG